jgi:hypothetical protein
MPSFYIRLDGLPFESNRFDFVRIVGIGLGVPEDEVSEHLKFELPDCLQTRLLVAICLGGMLKPQCARFVTDIYFQEIFRVLKPGAPLEVCLKTIHDFRSGC